MAVFCILQSASACVGIDMACEALYVGTVLDASGSATLLLRHIMGMRTSVLHEHL